jgi:hypothetical protein
MVKVTPQQALSFVTSSSKFLWFGYSADSVSLRQAAQAMVLDDEVYATVRATIAKKLGKNATDFVADAPLGSG